jgi:dTDP-L-rhamnose 4-epimerase
VRVLVTGAAGFIGSHVVDVLLGRGHEVLTVDSLSSSVHATMPDYLDPAAVHLRADVRDADAMREAVRGIDAVCHHASMVGLGVDFGDVTDFVSHNVVGTATLLSALHDERFTGSIVLASSMVVYGEGRYRCDAHGVVRPGPRSAQDLEAERYEPTCPTCGAALAAEAVLEDACLDPRTIYAATKVHQEHLCTAYAREHRSRLATLRYHNVYGPRMPRDTPYAGVASIVRSALERGEPPTVFEDGRQMRNFVHVTDVARANVLALDAGADGAFNIASSEPHTVGEMADALCDAAGAEAPRPRFVGQARLGDVRHIFASPAKAARELGFRSTVGFAEGMAAFVADPLRGSSRAPGQAPANGNVASRRSDPSS